MDKTTVDEIGGNFDTLIQVSFDNESNSYNVELGKESSVSETIFAMNVVLRCLRREGYIDNFEDAINMLKKFLTDEQFNEVLN